MTVKDAVKTAINYTKDLFSDESILNLGLEEVVFDDSTNEWNITVGFSLPWSIKKSNLGPISAIINDGNLPRVYKVVKINAATSDIKSIKNS